MEKVSTAIYTKAFREYAIKLTTEGEGLNILELEQESIRYPF